MLKILGTVTQPPPVVRTGGARRYQSFQHVRLEARRVYPRWVQVACDSEGEAKSLAAVMYSNPERYQTVRRGTTVYMQAKP